ncbi:MAG: TRAP transporter large permease [Christensenellales bacterium]|nr:TRAP transporter large permease [Christensenellales bacterium]
MIWIMIIMIVALALIGVPMSFSMLTGSVWFMLTSGMPQTLMIQRLIMAVGDSFSMLAIPFFMLAGTIMNAGGVATRIFDFCNTLVGHIPGGLGHVNVFCSVIFAGMSGSALADTGGIGAIELKAMKDQGFDEDFSAAITGASSCLGPIIPPSTGMVLYAMMAEESVGTLFIAGVLPGIIMAAAMCLIVYITAKRRNYPISPRVTWKERGRAFWRAVPALLSPIILLSGILLGIFSATEASVVCCLYSLFLGIFIYKELSPKGLYNVFLDTLKSSGMVMALVTFSMLLATILNYNQIPQAVAAWAVTHITSKVGIILACMVLIIIAGMVIDVTPAMLILIPIMMPVIRQYGINPIAFGVASTLLFSQGLLTPPVGSILYVLADYTKMPVMRIAKNMIPYIITFMVLAFCFMMFPQICTFLPGLIQ